MARITGTDGNDVLDGTSGDDVIFALAGDDLISAGARNDIAHGEAGGGSPDNGILAIELATGDSDILFHVERLRFSDTDYLLV